MISRPAAAALVLWVAAGVGCGRSALDDLAAPEPAGGSERPRKPREKGLRDTNGDGFDDLVFSDSATGRIYVHNGGAAGLGGAPSQTIDGMAAALPVEAVGRLGADLLADVVHVGNSMAGGGAALEATAHHGSKMGLVGPSPLGVMGAVVIGDFDGNGLGDLVVAEPLYGIGYAYFSGDSQGVSRNRFRWAEKFEGGSTLFAETVAAGDFDGDGFDDLAIGTFGELDFRGQVRVYAGGASGPRAAATMILEPPGGLKMFGGGLAVGDFDADGRDDLAVGAVEEPASLAVIYPGGTSGVGSPSALLRIAPGTCRYPGVPALLAADVDGDGRDDLVAAHCGEESAGVSVFGSMRGGVSAAPLEVGSTGDGQFGVTAAAAGDLDGDGYEDFAVGALDRIHVYRGGPVGPGVSPAWSIDVRGGGLIGAAAR